MKNSQPPASSLKLTDWQTISDPVVIPVGFSLLEQVCHHRNVGVARVVQAGKLEPSFHGLQEREMVVKDVALHAVDAVVGVHDQ